MASDTSAMRNAARITELADNLTALTADVDERDTRNAAALAELAARLTALEQRPTANVTTTVK